MPNLTPTGANPRAVDSIPRLIARFAIPAIISGLVNALYNIVDQIFIGQGVGMLGNAATNVAFPLNTISTAMALLLGVGSASNFNLAMGAGDKERARRIAGNGFSLLAIGGVSLAVFVFLFLDQLLLLFGATPEVFDYARTYTGITTLGLPFIIFAVGGSSLVRADGSPAYSMLCVLSGALLNTILDPIFLFVFGWGIAGAAWATITGQIVAASLVAVYITRFKAVRITWADLRPRLKLLGAIAALGAAACFNQLAMMLVQVTLNNTLTHYGALSDYGSNIPLACVGVISKVNIVFMAFVLGISQGCQPIFGFNYGAGRYSRVRSTYKTAAFIVTGLSTVAFVLFQCFPRQIVSIFGQGSPLYFQFAQRYMRIYMMVIFANGIQPITSNFFTSIGRAKMGILISLTRQILFLLPLIVLFPIFFGIDGVMYAGPIADTAALTLAGVLMVREFRRMPAQDKPITAQE